jgi:surface protein
MFDHCQSLTILDVSNWNTGLVTNMSSMFYYCPNLTTLDVSNFDTSKVINMSYMFDTCSKLTTLDLSSFNTSKATSMSNMFYSCYMLFKIKLGQNFSFNGSGTSRKVSLQNPNKKYFPTTNGRWTNIETGESYLGEEVPNNIAAIYYAYIDTTWEYEAKKCINAYKQVVGLNEVKVADICPGISSLNSIKYNFNNDIYFSSADPTDADGKDGDLWVVIE